MADSHAGVRRAFRKVGDQLEAERLARIAARDAVAAAPELPTWQLRQLAPCIVPGCGRTPARPYLDGTFCDELHGKPAPAGGYCAPGRCYCRTKPCRRPA